MDGDSRREPPRHGWRLTTRASTLLESLRRSAGSKVMAYARSSEFPFLASSWIVVCAMGVVGATLMYFFS